MYEETKKTVKEVIRICKILFSLSIEEYNKLLEITDNIELPTRYDFEIKLKEKYNEDELNNNFETELILYLKDLYSKTAMDYGFTSEQGIAVLEYILLIKELEE